MFLKKMLFGNIVYFYVILKYSEFENTVFAFMFVYFSVYILNFNESRSIIKSKLYIAN